MISNHPKIKPDTLSIGNGPVQRVIVEQSIGPSNKSVKLMCGQRIHRSAGTAGWTLLCIGRHVLCVCVCMCVCVCVL